MAESKRTARIAGMGMYAPPKVMTNEDFAQIVDTSDEWITQMTGIKERHIAEDDVTTSDMAAEAARNALENAGVEPEQVEMIILGTATPDMLFPSTACLVQAKIGAVNAFAYDMAAGCSGFIYGLSIARQFIEAGTVEKVLVIGAENLTKFMDMSDRNTCVLFGDGAGAAVVVPTCEPDGIVHQVLGSDGRLGGLLECPAGGARMPASRETVDERQHYIKMQGRKVYVNAVKAMGDSVVRVIEEAGITGDDVDILFPHQANIRIIQSVAERAGTPIEKVYVNIHKYGNTSAASIPIAMTEAIEEGRLKNGMTVAMVAFGAGFTWGSLLMRY
ncbi:MAG: beta-ketoacyl-ACP synthase III [Candidatus Eisenbacteria bacterium]|nr:beta-ketoacyl-ACP synthase III [Candidatus Eisenbacteria bacterium]